MGEASDAQDEGEVNSGIVHLAQWALANQVDLSTLVKHAKVVAASNGVLLIYPERIKVTPFTLFPSPVPYKDFKFVKGLQTHFNALYHKVALDSEFLQKSLETLIPSEDFARSLWGIYEKSRVKKLHQSHLGIFRADYMLQRTSSEAEQVCCMRQIEVNTMAASFLGLANSVCHVHRYICGVSNPYFCSANSCQSEAAVKLPQPDHNQCLLEVGQALATAFHYYSQGISPLSTTPKQDLCVVFVVEAEEKNLVDQMRLQEELTKNMECFRGVCVLRRTLSELSLGEVDEGGRFLLDNRRWEAAVFYMRSGYLPEHYFSSQEWNAREMMDCSLAISCPSVAYQLAGLKKIQQVLCSPGSVERFCSEPENSRNIRATFAAIYALDQGSEGDEAVAKALRNPGKYVLKPQREGGANNYFDDELVKELELVKDSSERQKYILMERIFPPSNKNIIVRDDEDTEMRDVISELGIYGVILSDIKGEILDNRSVGHLLRSKDVSKADGGVVVGNACLDSPMFYSSNC